MDVGRRFQGRYAWNGRLLRWPVLNLFRAELADHDRNYRDACTQSEHPSTPGAATYILARHTRVFGTDALPLRRLSSGHAQEAARRAEAHERYPVAQPPNHEQERGLERRAHARAGPGERYADDEAHERRLGAEEERVEEDAERIAESIALLEKISIACEIEGDSSMRGNQDESASFRSHGS